MELLKKLFTAEMIRKGEGDKKGMYLFVISDGKKDRHGESINPNGWDFTEFNENPVALIGHDYRQLPVGKWLPPYVENGEVLAWLDLAGTERGEEARTLIEGGYLKTVSVGFGIGRWGGSGEEYDIMESKLYEVSLVSIPANTRARRVKDASALEAFEKLDKAIEKEGIEKPVTIKQSELKNLIAETVKEALAGVKVVEEKIVEKEVKVYIAKDELTPEAKTILMHIAKQADKSAKKNDFVHNFIKSLTKDATVTGEQEGGEK